MILDFAGVEHCPGHLGVSENLFEVDPQQVVFGKDFDLRQLDGTRPWIAVVFDPSYAFLEVKQKEGQVKGRRKV